jgi:hypothetical protein
MDITSFSLSEVEYDKIKYVVMIAEFKGNLVIIKHKNKMGIAGWKARSRRTTIESSK